MICCKRSAFSEQPAHRGSGAASHSLRLENGRAAVKTGATKTKENKYFILMEELIEVIEAKMIVTLGLWENEDSREALMLLEMF